MLLLGCSYIYYSYLLDSLVLVTWLAGKIVSEMSCTRNVLSATLNPIIPSYHIFLMSVFELSKPCVVYPSLLMHVLKEHIVWTLLFQLVQYGSNRCKTLLLVLLLRLVNPHISLPFSNLSTGVRSTNSFTVCTLHLLSLLPGNHPLTLKIAHLDMHHLIFGINSQIHSINLTSLVLIHLLIHLSTHLSHHPCSHHSSLFHSRLKTYLFNKSFLPWINNCE